MTGFSIATAKSLTHIQIILFAFPSTLSGFLTGIIQANLIVGVLLPIAILLGRDIEQISDPYEKCKLLCRSARQYHNKKIQLEIKNSRPILEDAADAL